MYHTGCVYHAGWSYTPRPSPTYQPKFDRYQFFFFWQFAGYLYSELKLAAALVVRQQPKRLFLVLLCSVSIAAAATAVSRPGRYVVDAETKCFSSVVLSPPPHFFCIVCLLLLILLHSTSIFSCLFSYFRTSKCYFVFLAVLLLYLLLSLSCFAAPSLLKEFS